MDLGARSCITSHRPSSNGTGLGRQRLKLNIQRNLAHLARGMPDNQVGDTAGFEDDEELTFARCADLVQWDP